MIHSDQKCIGCNSQMELSKKGYVCRNHKCKFFKSPFHYPPVKPHSTPLSSEELAKKYLPVVTPTTKCCPKAMFDVRVFFESMNYLGSVRSRTNQYFCYEYDDVFMASTGLKELTRFNMVHQKDLDIVTTIIQDKLATSPFSAEDLRSVCLNTPCNSGRLTEIQHLERQGKAEHNELYWLMLAWCYILTAKGILSLGKSGHSILFELKENQDLFTTDDSIFSNVKFLANLNENTGAFEMDPFYLEVRCNVYRGSIVPYIKEEIEYLAELIIPIKSKQRLDIPTLMQSMDYSHRFHRLYDLLGWRNLRNDREEREYFERRIKSALDLVAKLKGTVKADKEGHTKVFYKR
jgi:hypothetical protein